jgi:cysteine desulfurase
MGEAIAYLDYNATTPLRPSALEAMTAAARLVGNPSSSHAAGRAARHALEEARAKVAAAVGCAVSEVIFTSGGTEANNLAVLGLGQSVLYAATEHDAVRAPARTRGGEVIAVDGNGLLDLNILQDHLKKAPRPALVAVMLANNETGVIAPLAKIADLTHRHGGLVHCDAIQALGKIPFNFRELGVDSLSLSAHKAGGPKGVGALILKDGLEIAPLIRGGGQERRRRAGTENLPGIVGFAAALEARGDWDAIRAMRDRMEADIAARMPTARIFGQTALRLPNTTCVSLPGIASETQVMALDLAGVCISAGAACSSGKVALSHVLDAMGVAPELAASAIRISLGWETTARDIDRFLAAWDTLAERALAAGAAA